MKTNWIKRVSKSKRAVIVILLSLLIGCDNSSNAQRKDPTPNDKKSIKLAILLDTSNSMDGLIEQAKSQLWSIVSELALAKCDNTKPTLKIALYEYGNDNLPASEGYIRLVTPLTTDLDQVSDDLFSLRTCGGQEFCGQVINSALKELDWSLSSKDYQVIFIAGNEPFTQGSYDYREVCAAAKRKGVVVNTIFCGNFDEGLRTSWKKGAELTGGNYFSIEQNRKTVYIDSPYDKKIAELNVKLNNTYIYYGGSGKEKKMLQSRQDMNAEQYGTANVVNRTVSKSSHVYKNSSWDLVDASEEAEFDIAEISEDQLPPEMKQMDDNERTKYIEQQKQERDKIKKEINTLNQKRIEYLAQQQTGESGEGMLDNAMISAIKKQANTKNFRFK